MTIDLSVPKAPGASAPPAVPRARGPLSARLITALSGPPTGLGPLVPGASVDPLVDEDLHAALYTAYELHYRGLAGVDERWEWHPALRSAVLPLEVAFERALRDEAGPLPCPGPEEIALALADELARDDGRSLSSFVALEGTLDHLREFAVHRSPYQRKEADPHSFALARLDGAAKAALVEIQADEYGNGIPGRAHADLFAETMVALGLDPAYGAYVDVVPGTTLATVNLITLFGLHRRLRGALIGHLAAFEMTSVVPMGRYASAFVRHGVVGHEFYDVHVEADAHHEQVAAHGLAAGLVRDEPPLGREVLFGAAALTCVERRFADHLLDRWQRGRTSLCGSVRG